MTAVVWIYQILFMLPFTIFNTLGLQSLGVCDVLNFQSYFKRYLLHIYYICGILGLYFVLYSLLILAYSKVVSWIKTMSSKQTLSKQNSETLSETKEVMRLTKWITITPLIATSPS
jgi:hypothetical protein